MALLKKLKPDVVLTYTIKPNIYGGMACQLRRIPYIANITGLGSAIENGGLLRLFSVALYKVGLRKASCVFVQNSSNLRLFVDGGIVRRRTRLVPGSGVNLAARQKMEREFDRNIVLNAYREEIENAFASVGN